MNDNLLKYKDIYGTAEYSAPDKIFFGQIIGARGLVLYEGESVEELEKDFHEAVDDYLESCKSKGIEPLKSYKGSMNIRLQEHLHKALDENAHALGISINRLINLTVEFSFSKKDAFQKAVKKELGKKITA